MYIYIHISDFLSSAPRPKSILCIYIRYIAFYFFGIGFHGNVIMCIYIRYIAFSWFPVAVKSRKSQMCYFFLEKSQFSWSTFLESANVVYITTPYDVFKTKHKTLRNVSRHAFARFVRKLDPLFSLFSLGNCILCIYIYVFWTFYFIFRKSHMEQ